jgi:hypothetical protein
LPSPKSHSKRKLVYWIRDLLRSNGELVPVLEHLRRSYRELRDGEPVTDCEVALQRVEQALKAAEESSLLDWPGSVNRTKLNHPSAIFWALKYQPKTPIYMFTGRQIE